MDETIVARELQESEDFDPCSIWEQASFTQGRLYGEWQRNLGRKVRRFVIESGSQTLAYFQTIQYPLIFGKNYLYVPYGPIAVSLTKEVLRCIKHTLEKISKEDSAVFARLDFSPPLTERDEALMKKYFHTAPSYTYHAAHFQPRNEWTLPLRETEEALLANMHEKTRYSIRLAARKGVETSIIENNFQEYFEHFYALLRATAKRNGFALHAEEYYRNIFDTPGERSFLSVTKYEGEICVINFVVPFGEVANFVFGGSSDAHRNVMPSYAGHWTGILHAKKIGCAEYNFGGFSDEANAAGWEGFSAFKKKFGGNMVAHSPLYDVVWQPVWYHLYNARKFIKQYV